LYWRRYYNYVSNTIHLLLGGRILLPEWNHGGADWGRYFEVRKVTFKNKKEGLGVFAACNLPRFCFIPIAAVPQELVEGTGAGSETHGWVVSLAGKRECSIDGRPGVHPHPVTGVGSFGLAISSLINEPTRCNMVPNCVFKFNNYVVTVRPLRAGQQLSVYYGPKYKRVGYEDEWESTLSSECYDAEALERVEPAASLRSHVSDLLMAMCEEASAKAAATALDDLIIYI
jgi:hypothetical protein